MYSFIANWRVLVLVAGVVITSSRVISQTDVCGAFPKGGKQLPDLIVDGPKLAGDIVVTYEKFSDTSCAVVEGCVRQKGWHTLMRFTSAFANIGQGDLVIGDPNQCSTLFHLSECHGHFHMEDSADYRLWTQAGYDTWSQKRRADEPANSSWNAPLLAAAEASGALIDGRKQGFCMIDSFNYSASPSSKAKYTSCGYPGYPGYQGIQAGWEDSYSYYLDCQYIQIDKISSGRYVLEVQTNPDHVLAEAAYFNNASAVVLDYSVAKGKSPANVAIVAILQ